MRFRFVDIVGTYRLVVSDELLAFIEREFVATAAAHEREAVRAAAISEAENAELDVRADGCIESRSEGRSFYEIRVCETVDLRRLVDEIPFVKAPGQSVILRRIDANTLVAIQAGKPPARFRRMGPNQPA